MSEGGIDWPLEPGETILWQGRPAPRCYTFRNWKLVLAGTALFLACSFWLMLGAQLVEAEGYSSVLILMTLPLVLATFFLGPGQLLLARWRWEKLFYALTEERLLVRTGLISAQIFSYARSEITGWQQLLRYLPPRTPPGHSQGESV